MANEKHIYVTITGSYTSAMPALAGETWQTGLRFACVFGNVDDIGTLPNNWEPIAQSINRIETDWTISGNWYVEGPIAATWQVDDWLNDQVAPAVATWIAATNQANRYVQVDEIKAYPIGTNGRAVPAVPYAVGSPILLTFTGTKPKGSMASEVLPPQNSIVCSTRTQQLGRRGRGRLFMPPVGNAGISNGVVFSTYVTSMLANCEALIEGCAYDGVLGTSPTVRPIVTGAPFNQYAVINEIRIGNVVDTQRRRRKSVTETVVAQALTY